MKKLLLFMMALACINLSCQKDSTSFDHNDKDAIDVTIGVGVPELGITRSGETAMNSGLGAIDNFNQGNKDEWTKYDLRYILEVYDTTEGFVNLDTPVKRRDVQIFNEYTPTTFTLRLVPNRTYRFVVWADFVSEGAKADDDVNDDLHYSTTNLRAIARIAASGATHEVGMDECYDAYFIQKDLFVGTNGINESLTLKRPFGKIRVITTDYDEVNIGTTPSRVKVEFYNHKLFATLDAVTGVASGESVKTYDYAIDKSSPYSEGYDKEAYNMTLFTDYILAADETKGAQEVNFKIEVLDQNSREVNSHDFNTQIPLQRNYLTTIIGNLLTTQNDINITINDNFSGEYVRNHDDQAVTIANGNWGTGELNANSNYQFKVNDGANDFYVILPKDAIDPATNALKAYNAEFVATEDKLTTNTFTVEGLKVDPTRAAAVDATVVSGTLTAEAVADSGDVSIKIDLCYTTNPKDETPQYKNISFEYEGETLVKSTLAKPEATAEVAGNVVTLSWEAVDGAASYTLTGVEEQPVSTEETTYIFTGKYETEYTFTIVATPSDPDKNSPSEATEVTATTEAAPEPVPVPVEVTYNFAQIDGFSTWGSTYSSHTVEYDEATVCFSSANKQGSTITDIPVTKGSDVTLVAKSGATLVSAKFVCQQWTTKTQTITLYYSTDSGESYTTTGITSSNFEISCLQLPEGTNAVKIGFSSTKNQIGIQSATITYLQ
ncbi:MAG: hypothetical protein E7146_05320 [Rikenellaceae bacterium]|nr:hypothetical protein [Rikenellaceae bacterium]